MAMPNSRADDGERVASQLAYLHFLYEQADEVFRRFRSGMNTTSEGEQPKVQVLEWVPFSPN
jgi:hypothetical protein